MDASAAASSSLSSRIGEPASSIKVSRTRP